jgi:hypothetical protein
MAGIDNLRTPTTEEAREIGRKGGIASGEARRRKKELRELIEAAFDREIVNNATGERMRTDEAMVLKQIQNALEGDTRAFVVLRDTIGQMPTQRVEVGNIPKETYDRVMSVL